MTSDLHPEIQANTGFKDFKELYSEYAPFVRTIINRKFSYLQGHELDDVVQQTFYLFHKHSERFDSEKASTKTWLTTIAKTEAARYVRNKKRFPRLLSEPLDENLIGPSERLWGSSQFDRVEEKIYAQQLIEYAGRKNSKYSDALTLIADGYDKRKARKKVGLTQEKLNRKLKKLKRKFSD